MAKANAIAMNLIIVFSVLSLRGEKTPSRSARLDASARLARAGREKTGANRPHRRLDGGTNDKRCGYWNELNGKPLQRTGQNCSPADQLPSEPFVMPGVSCKTMFNNELWTSKPPKPPL
jgi:hypothetical protein